MNTQLTDITFVVDRSGSMQDIREDAEGGINAFIDDQAKQPDDALLTLVQFDTEYEFIHRGVPVRNVPKFHLVPRGATALLDAVGRAINETGERLSKIEESARPGLVIFVVMTDGMENSSSEFTLNRIREMILHQQEKYAWQFTFLGADQDAFAEGGRLGIDAAGIAGFSKARVVETCAALGGKVARMRKQAQAGDTVCNEFTTDELAVMED